MLVAPSRVITEFPTAYGDSWYVTFQNDGPISCWIRSMMHVSEIGGAPIGRRMTVTMSPMSRWSSSEKELCGVAAASTDTCLR